jgi:hypothetical protein
MYTWLIVHSAGATAIIKCTTLPKLSSGDFTCKSLPTSATPGHQDFAILPPAISRVPTNMLLDHGSSLGIWSTAEPATTIMAACIPVLRILVRQARSSGRETDPTGGRTKGTGAVTVISVGTRMKSRAHHDVDDTGSDKSILERHFVAGNQIVQTDEYRVEFQESHHRDSKGHADTGAYEMASNAATAKA